MNVADPLRLFALLCALTACSESTSPVVRDLNGNFEGVLQTGGLPWYLGLTLAENGSAVTGAGFLSVYPANELAVSGTADGEDVELNIVPPGIPGTYQFSGVIRGDTISGSFVPGGGPALPFELVRVDTVASGRLELALSQSIVREEEGSATFTYIVEHRLVILSLESSDAGPGLRMSFVWDGLQYPAAGAYTIGQAGAPRVSAEDVLISGAPRALTVENGTFVIDRARRFALIGSLDLVLRDEEARRTRVQGRFSAGCRASAYC